jgi:hypothetical protein
MPACLRFRGCKYFWPRVFPSRVSLIPLLPTLNSVPDHCRSHELLSQHPHLARQMALCVLQDCGSPCDEWHWEKRKELAALGVAEGAKGLGQER